MSERQLSDLVTDPAISFMRRQRLARQWSAATLVQRCVEYGQAQQPPMDTSTFSRPRVAKLESGKAKQLWAHEIAILAGVFGVAVETVITNSDPLLPEAASGQATVAQSGTMLERLGRLERGAESSQAVLRRLAALENTVRLLQETVGVSSPAVPQQFPEPSWAACVQVELTPAA